MTRIKQQLSKRNKKSYLQSSPFFKELGVNPINNKIKHTGYAI